MTSHRGPAAGGYQPRAFAPHEPLLEISGLCVDYGVGDTAVRAVTSADLVLHRGEVLGLAGESGSGKSTLAYAAIRLLRPPGIITGGSVRYHPAPGETLNLLAANEEELRGLRWSHIAVVLQSAMNALNPVLRIGVQLTDVLHAHEPAMSRESQRERAGELLELVGISADRLSSYPHELSGGMRQRVMIAMALALEPRILIMDEPTTALDVVTQREILEELISLRERLGFSVLFITHDLSLLVEMADAIAVMYAGRIVERASAQALFRAPRHPYSLGLINSFPPMHGPHRDMTGIPGSPPDLRALPSGCVFHPRCRFAFDRCPREVPPLLKLPAGREAACWLQDGSVPVPPQLGEPEPGYGPAPAVTIEHAAASPPPPAGRHGKEPAATEHMGSTP
jgi:peptide/nickel transport system ATP-binding protein